MSSVQAFTVASNSSLCVKIVWKVLLDHELVALVEIELCFKLFNLINILM